MKREKIRCSLSLMVICFYILISFTTFAQETYMLSYQYAEAFKDSVESKLVVQGKESVFKILDNRQGGFVYKEDGSTDYYLVNDRLSTFTYSDGSFSYVRIPYPVSRGGTMYAYDQNVLEWQLTGETKKIKEYNCQEALLELHGRKYQVWFAPEIPIHSGPLKLHGLPGMIVEVFERTGRLSIKLVNLKKAVEQPYLKEVKAFFKENKEVLKYPDYESFMKKFIVDTKIKKAKIFAEMLEEQGGTVEISYELGQYAFVENIIDIPEGTIEELEKIYFYD